MNGKQTFFSALNFFFDKIYVVTLKRATERHEHIQKELSGLHYSFFFGKDKQGFSIEELEQANIYSEALAKRHHRFNKPMKAGQIGCAWSHAEVYKDAVQNGYEKVLVLEDDVVIDEGTAATFSTALKELPGDWELLYFGYAQNEKAPPGFLFKRLFYHLLRLFGAIRYSHKTINHLYAKKISAHIYQAGYHDCTHAYAITQSAAKKLLRLQQPVSFVADNLLAHAVTNEIVNGYFVRPKIIYQQCQLGIASISYLNQ